MPKAALDSLAYELGTAKLASSGLTLDDYADLNLEFLEPHETAKLHASFQAKPAIKIPYYSLDSKTPLTAWPAWPDFYRIRYLEAPKPEAVNFGDLTTKKKKEPKYVQEPNSGVCAYFPKTTEWAEIATDPSFPIIITEGEFKAAKASKEGFACIGLGGIYSFKSSKLGVVFLPELLKINWVKRIVYIIYDSDFRTNKNVCQALNELAEELMGRGAMPHCVFLPQLDSGGKCGLDDFLLAEGPDNLWPLLEAGQPLTLARPLWKLNDRLTYVMNPGLIIDRVTSQKLNPSAFQSHSYAAVEDFAERVVKDDGSISLKKASASAAWIKWPQRSQASRLVYYPGIEEFLPDGSDVALNIWPGWGCGPVPGNVQPFFDLVNHIFSKATPEDLEWFLRWCAYPLQFPGTKLFTSAVLFGIKHGTGKSLIGYTLGKIYGKNFAEISQQDLHGSFNEWAESKQFVLGDDVTGSNKREDADMLKKMITQKTIRINAKFIPTYVIDDCINYFFTSNQPDAFFLEDDDRRHFIHEVVVEPLTSEFYNSYGEWLANGGASALFDYFLKLDLGDFNPAAPARKTTAKYRMIADVKSDLGSWVARLLAGPDEVLTVGQTKLPGDLFTTRQLLGLYDPEGKFKTTANGLSRELRKAGVVLVCEGRPVRTCEGQDRYYALRNPAAWIEATAAEVADHVKLKLSGKTPPKY